MQDLRVSTGQSAWGFLVAPSRQVPASYPAPVRFTAPTQDAVWWAWRQPNSGILSAYISWANARTVVINCRSMLERDSRLTNERTFDGRAAGPMGPAMNATIDDAMLRRLWAWLARARREGRGVVTQSVLDVVASAARSRSTPDGLVEAMILCAWHTGGLTGASAPSLMSPGEFFLVLAPGNMPRYGESLLMVDQATSYVPLAMVNNLDNVPRSGYAQLDAWRTTSGAAVSTASSQGQGSIQPTPPSTTAPVSSLPATTSSTTSSSTTSSSTNGSNKGGSPWSATGPVYQQPGSSSSPSVTYNEAVSVYDEFGRPTSPNSMTQPVQGSTPSAPSTPSNLQGPVSAAPSPVPAGERAAAPVPVGALSNSLVDVAKNAWPYALAGGLILAGGGAAYWAYRKMSEREDDAPSFEGYRRR